MRSLEAGQRAEQIGQFGVGFYSLFMVATEVRVTSLSYRPDATAWTWISAGEENYRLEPGEATTHGTTITIHLKEDAAEFAERSRLSAIVHRHSDFVSFPIYVATASAIARPRCGGSPPPRSKRTRPMNSTSNSPTIPPIRCCGCR